MSTTLIDRRTPGTPCGCRPAPEKTAKKAPRVVLGLGAAPLAAKAAAALRALGFEVTLAGTGEEARRLAVRGRAHAVVLGAGAGLLETAKLVTALPRRTKVVLVGTSEDTRMARASGYLGMAFVTEADGPEALVAAVRGATAA